MMRTIEINVLRSSWKSESGLSKKRHSERRMWDHGYCEIRTGKEKRLDEDQVVSDFIERTKSAQ